MSEIKIKMRSGIKSLSEILPWLLFGIWFLRQTEKVKA